MKKEIIFFLIIFITFQYCNAQFLGYIESDKTTNISLNYLDDYFRYNGSEEFFLNKPIYFKAKVPSISYEDETIFAEIAFNNFTANEMKTKYFSIDFFYKSLIPLTMPRSSFSVGIPLLVRTIYFSNSQEDGSYVLRFENGNIGIGSGIELKQVLPWVIIKFSYNASIYYSTNGFSYDYGISYRNDIKFSLDFNDFFYDYGIKIGSKFFDFAWSIKDKKQNYYHSGFGFFIGLNF
jgi:hypothetical protein